MKEWLEELYIKTKDDIKYWKEEIQKDVKKGSFSWAKDNMEIYDKLWIELGLLTLILEKLGELSNV